MTILYSPGKLHGNADPLSRIDNSPCSCEDRPDHGHRFILMMIDYYSKWAEVYALPNHKAETVANCIVPR